MCLLYARHLCVLMHFILMMFIRKYDYPIFQMPKIRLERTAITCPKAYSLEVTGSPLLPFVIGHTRMGMPFIVQPGNYDTVCKHKEFPPRRSKNQGLAAFQKKYFHPFFFL